VLATLKRIARPAALAAGLALFASSLGGIAAVDQTLKTAVTEQHPDTTLRVVAGRSECPRQRRRPGDRAPRQHDLDV
jgi:hypothetical protein